MQLLFKMLFKNVIDHQAIMIIMITVGIAGIGTCFKKKKIIKVIKITKKLHFGKYLPIICLCTLKLKITYCYTYINYAKCLEVDEVSKNF